VASLFPHSPGLDERERLVVAVDPGLEPFIQRVTLTPGPLRSGLTVVFLVTGEGKADAVAKALAGPPTPEVPGSLIRSEAGRTIAVVDQAAAAGLRDSMPS
jgi:6-phosphogluconolactonase